MISLFCIPELQAMGVARLQALCDQWIRTPQAKEFAVEKVSVSVLNGEIVGGWLIRTDATYEAGEVVRFPADHLLLFLVEHGIESNQERACISERIRRGFAVYPKVLREYVIKPGSNLPLLLRCKKCGQIMKTDISKRPWEVVKPWNGSYRCLACGGTADYTHKDFFQELG